MVEYKRTRVSTEITCFPAASAILTEHNPKYKPTPQWVFGIGLSDPPIKYNLCSI